MIWVGVALCVIGWTTCAVGIMRSGPTAPVDGYDVLGFGSFCFGVGLIVGTALG